jgi:hypothetical protein
MKKNAFRKSEDDALIRAHLDKQVIPAQRRIVTGWNEEQIAFLESLWGKPITSSADCKQAIREIIGLPEDAKAGAPKGNQNSKNKG